MATTGKDLRMLTALVVICLAAFGAQSASLSLGQANPTAGQLNVAAFNIEVFGVAKMGKPHVVEALVQILTRYDLVLIQEIRDITETAIYELLDEVNAVSGSDIYHMKLSIRLGRTSSKEQYAYFYRPSKLQVVGTYQWEDEADIFERPPFMVRFRASGNAVGEFGFMGIHVKPSDAVAENDALVDVYDAMQSIWGLEDFIIGGDLNAGCSYVRPDDFDNIRLWTESRFNVIIDHDADTTIATSQCPYDRFILARSSLNSAYVTGGAHPYRFDDDMGMTQDEAKEVSDHVPIEMLLR